MDKIVKNNGYMVEELAKNNVRMTEVAKILDI